MEATPEFSYQPTRLADALNSQRSAIVLMLAWLIAMTAAVLAALRRIPTEA